VSNDSCHSANSGFGRTIGMSLIQVKITASGRGAESVSRWIFFRRRMQRKILLISGLTWMRRIDLDSLRQPQLRAFETTTVHLVMTLTVASRISQDIRLNLCPLALLLPKHSRRSQTAFRASCSFHCAAGLLSVRCEHISDHPQRRFSSAFDVLGGARAGCRRRS
jgi:hypothetical protein